jgi:serine/threonine-protein kinase/endoribonuclease IRE1
LELCAAPLQDFIYGKYRGPMPTDEQVLFQLANGLEYIHSMEFLHRTIEPENILISKTKPVQMKWSGFWASKPVNENGSCSLSGLRGTYNWMPPEQLRIMKSEENADHGRGSVKSEIFSAGCVFIFFLLSGKHPFGDESNNIPKNVLRGDPVNVKGS